jgi:hypothetical protein
MCVLIKAVKFLQLRWQMEVGTFGVLDYLCRKYCNPSPGDGSAPNLVIIAHDKNGNPYVKRAFNTQVFIYLFNYFLAEHHILRFVNNSMHGLLDINQSSNV